MATLHIVRGLPGSGKSTLARALGIPVFEADDWFTNANSGEYFFDPGQLSVAHTYCLNRTRVTLGNGFDCAVANTFIMQWEVQPYIDYCKANNHQIKVIEASGNFKSIHGISDAGMGRMRAKYQQIVL